MISGISSTLSAGTTAPAGGGFDVELAKYQSQLSDWVHCPSCKTPQGKAKIAEITARIDAIRARSAQREQTVRREPASLDAAAPGPSGVRKASPLNVLGAVVNLVA